MTSSQTITVRIKGGKPLHGSVKIVPNKNAVLPAIAASLLTNDEMIYHNIPRSPDVMKMLAAMQAMGATVDATTSTITICCKGVNTHIVPVKHIYDMQAGYLFAAPLLAKFGEALIPVASGCRLGYRGPEGHAEYLRKLGVQFKITEQGIHFELRESISDPRITVLDESLENRRTITFQSPYVTPTENVLMLLAKTSRYNTEVSGIAQEPHVAQLLGLLEKMHARIIGKGSTVCIAGADRLYGTEFTAEPDHIDYFGFAATAVITKSDLLLEVPTRPLPNGIAHMNEFLEEMGVMTEVVENGVWIYGSRSLFSPAPTFPKISEDMYKMYPTPWPGFPVDCLPSFIALSTMNPNPHTMTRSMNWLYTDGLTYIPTLKEMGAKILSNDDQRVTVMGVEGGNPYENKVTTVNAPGVIEGERAIISCALAGGEHTIKSLGYILRRNPQYFAILENLGADITIDKSPLEEVIL